MCTYCRSLTSHPKTNNNDIQRANQETEEGQVHIGGIYDDEEAIHVKILEIIDDLSSGQQTLVTTCTPQSRIYKNTDRKWQETDTFEEYIEEEDDDGKKFVRQKDDLPAERVLYYVYRSSASRRQKILQYAIFTTAHLGVFAFLFQVFDDRGVIMQVCCYSQLAVLLLCFLLYPFSYLLDIMAVFRIQQAAKYFEFLEREEYYLEQESGTRYIHRIYVVNEFEISPNQSTEKQKKLDGITWTTWGLVDSNSYTSPILDVLFAVTALMVECLTIVYVYNNTRQDDRKQGDDESQALSAISNACKLLGCE